MKRGLLGLCVFALAVGIGVINEHVLRPRGSDLTLDLLDPVQVVRGYIGSEKAGFLANPAVAELLRDEYGLSVEFRRAGSFEMLELPHHDQDFLWPSSQVALEKYRQDVGAPLADALIFNSPIVLYSWAEVADALTAGGLVEFDGAGYQAQLAPLLQAVIDGRTWESFGVDTLFGRLVVTSTDPLRSNSGNMYAGLVAATLAGGVPDRSALERIEPDLLTVFRVQGQMEHSTGTLFERFLELGVGRFPLIVGYESQYIEFAREHPAQWPQLRDRLRLVYPVPTVWSSHPVIALTDAGVELTKALQDDRLQEIAWRRHGFRSGGLNVANDPAELGLERVARDVTRIVQMPRPQVMFAIMDAIATIP